MTVNMLIFSITSCDFPKHSKLFSSVQFSHSVVSYSLRPHELQQARPPCPLPTPGVHSNSRPSSRWCHPAISFSVVPFSSCPQSLPASDLFQWVISLHEVAKVLEFQLIIIPSKEISALISFRMNWLDLLGVQGTLKSLLQYHTSKASTLWHSAFFTVQLSHPYMTTGKTIALTRGTFVGKVMSLLFNMLSRLVITFLPRSKHLNFMAAITICSDFGAQKIKGWHCFHCFPIYLPWSDGTGCHDLSFQNVEL